MKIFHGSDVEVKNPQILPANRLLDFGEGFYTTSSYEQAERWAWRVCQRNKTPRKIITAYEFDFHEAERKINVMKYITPDSEWLRFVTYCRTGRNSGHNFDIVMGPVANDNVYATIQLFESGLLSEAETIIRLKTEKIYDQILFHTKESLKYLGYIKHEILENK